MPPTKSLSDYNEQATNALAACTILAHLKTKTQLALKHLLFTNTEFFNNTSISVNFYFSQIIEK